MKLNKSYISFSALVFSMTLIHACQQGFQYEQRDANTAASAQDSNANSDDNTSTDTNENAGEDDSSDTTPVEGFNMSWDESTDASIVSYKVFFLPPDSSRAPNASGVPIEIANYPIADLDLADGKFSLSLSDADIKSALGTLEVGQDQYCFSLVAVNNIGNSVHSAKVCP